MSKKFEKDAQEYLKLMGKIYADTSNAMMAKWMEQAREENPTKTTQEIYELWLEVCKDTYQKMLKTKTYQSAYTDVMNQALKYWELKTKE